MDKVGRDRGGRDSRRFGSMGLRRLGAMGSIGELQIDMVVRSARSAGLPTAARPSDRDLRWDDGTEQPPAAWSRQRAEAWRRGHTSASPWRVVAAQALAGVACAAVAAVLTERSGAVASSLWGAAASVVPSALLARGMTRGVRNPMAAATGFMFWEMLKIGVAVAMLAVAVKVVPNLNWPALLLTMFVCIKVNWIALLGRGRRPARPAEKA